MADAGALQSVCFPCAQDTSHKAHRTTTSKLANKQAVLGLLQLQSSHHDAQALSAALRDVLAFEQSQYQVTRAALAGAIASPLYPQLGPACKHHKSQQNNNNNDANTWMRQQMRHSSWDASCGS